MTIRRRALWRAALAAVLSLGLAGCEGLLQEPESGKLPVRLRMETVSGDDQIGSSGRALPAPVQVRIIDAEGMPVSRIRIEWTAATGRPDPRNSFSDADGIAATTWTLGPQAGAQELRADVGSAAGLVFRATGTP